MQTDVIYISTDQLIGYNSIKFLIEFKSIEFTSNEFY